MKKKHVYVFAAALTLVGAVVTTGLVSNADESSATSKKQILKLDKEDAWTDYVPSSGKDNPVYVAEDEIIYTDSQGNKVFEYLDPVDPGNEPATMPEEGFSTESEVQGDVMMIDESTTGNTTTDNTTADTSDSTNTQSSCNDSTQVDSNTQSSCNDSILVDTNTQLATGTSKVVENENGLLIQVFE